MYTRIKESQNKKLKLGLILGFLFALLFVAVGIVSSGAFSGVGGRAEASTSTHQSSIAPTATPDLTINTVAQFQNFRTTVNSGNNFHGQLVVLGADLNFNGSADWQLPIGDTAARAFRGTFCGNGFSISNFYGIVHNGFFGFVNDATIQNLVVNGFTSRIYRDLHASPAEDRHRGVAVIAANSAGASTFRNITINNMCITRHCTRVGSNDRGGAMGGIVGWNQAATGTTTFEDISVNGTVTHVVGPGHFATGGILGLHTGNGSLAFNRVGFNGDLIGSSHTGVSSEVRQQPLGGIVGHIETANTAANSTGQYNFSDIQVQLGRFSLETLDRSSPMVGSVLGSASRDLSAWNTSNFRQFTASITMNRIMVTQNSASSELRAARLTGAGTTGGSCAGGVIGAIAGASNANNLGAISIMGVVLDFNPLIIRSTGIRDARGLVTVRRNGTNPTIAAANINRRAGDISHLNSSHASLVSINAENGFARDTAWFADIANYEAMAFDFDNVWIMCPRNSRPFLRTVFGAAPLDAPVVTLNTPDDGGATISWNPVENAAEFRVHIDGYEFMAPNTASGRLVNLRTETGGGSSPIIDFTQPFNGLVTVTAIPSATNAELTESSPAEPNPRFIIARLPTPVITNAVAGILQGNVVEWDLDGDAVEYTIYIYNANETQRLHTITRTPAQMGVSGTLDLNPLDLPAGDVVIYLRAIASETRALSIDSLRCTGAVFNATSEPLLPPENLQLVRTGNGQGFVLSWNNPNNVINPGDTASYRVYRRVGAAGPFLHVGDSAASEFVYDMNLPAFSNAPGELWFMVRAVPHPGRGLTSSVQSASASGTLESQQLGTSIIGDGGLVRDELGRFILSFSRVEGAVAYRVYIREDAQTDYTPITSLILQGGTATVAGHVIFDALAGNTYHFRVRALASAFGGIISNPWFSDGELSASQQISLSVQTLEAPIVTLPSYFAAGTNAFASWNPVPNALFYRLYVNGTGVGGDRHSTQVNIGSLPQGTHTIQIRAIGCGEWFLNSELSAAGTTVVVSSLDGQLLAPTGVSVTATAPFILSWDAVADAVGYRIYLEDNGSLVAVYTIDGGSVTVWQLPDSLLTPAVRLFSVRALHEIPSLSSGPSLSYMHTITGILDVPTNFTSNQNILSWNPVANATRYEVFVNGLWHNAGTSTTFAIMPGMVAGTGTFIVHVRAIGNGGLPWNNSENATATVTITGFILATPTNLAVNLGVLTWNHPGFAENFIITVNGVSQTICGTLRSLTLTLAEGDNNISIQAISSDDFWENSGTAVITHRVCPADCDCPDCIDGCPDCQQDPCACPRFYCGVCGELLADCECDVPCVRCIECGNLIADCTCEDRPDFICIDCGLPLADCECGEPSVLCTTCGRLITECTCEDRPRYICVNCGEAYPCDCDNQKPLCTECGRLVANCECDNDNNLGFWDWPGFPGIFMPWQYPRNFWPWFFWGLFLILLIILCVVVPVVVVKKKRKAAFSTELNDLRTKAREAINTAFGELRQAGDLVTQCDLNPAMQPQAMTQLTKTDKAMSHAEQCVTEFLHAKKRDKKKAK